MLCLHNMCRSASQGPEEALNKSKPIGGQRGKEGEGSHQGTCVKDPLERTMEGGGGLNLGVSRAGESSGEKRGQL